MLASLDAPGDAAIQKLGDTTFFIYKLQHVSATQLMGSLKKFASDLEAKNADPELSSTIESMRWVSETNSILFIGSEPALKKIEQLTQQFDSGANAGRQSLRKAMSSTPPPTSTGTPSSKPSVSSAST